MVFFRLIITLKQRFLGQDVEIWKNKHENRNQRPKKHIDTSFDDDISIVNRFSDVCLPKLALRTNVRRGPLWSTELE